MNRFLRSPVLLLMLWMVAMNFLEGRFSDPFAWLTQTLLFLPGVVLGLTFHEFAHAWMADRLGDGTPRSQGRVTLNPLAHIDPFGMLALIFAGFGWGVPVQINPGNFRHWRRDNFLVAVAGVTMNFLLAVAFSGIMKAITVFFPDISGAMPGLGLMVVLQFVVLVNVVLMIFNLLPIPPLDGFSIITQVFNLRQDALYYKIYSNGFLILMLLLIFGVIEKILTPGVDFMMGFLERLFGV